MSSISRSTIGATRASLMAWFRAAPLPPGSLSTRLDQIEAADRLSLLRMAEELGPVFKGHAWGETWIYVVGLERCRRLARDHEAALRPVTIDASALFAKGLLRQMQGAEHRKYRQILTQALKPAMPAQDFAGMGGNVDGGLGRIEWPAGPDGDADVALRACLSGIAFDELVRLMFGVAPDDPSYDALVSAYRRLGGNGLVWNIGPRQTQAFQLIRDLLGAHDRDLPDRVSVLTQLRAQGDVDDDLLGNLIYAVEMGRYDLGAFLRWLLWFAAGAPDWMDRIAAEKGEGESAPAFVSEAFRLEQSERLVRRVERDFVAEGYLFPKGAKVRLCIWESHKSPEAHAQPFVFDPGRFIRERPGPDRFAPFGLDRHQCPFGTYATRFGAAFLKSVADRFVVSAASSASAVRGLYHWEPPADFRPVFSARPRGAAR